MIKVTNADFHKLVKLLAKEGQDGAPLRISISPFGSSLLIKTYDRANKEIIIELSDEANSFTPRVTRTETF